MPVDTHDPTAALSQLSSEIADAIRSYREIENRGDPAVQDLAGRLSAVHEAHAASLMDKVETMGGRPEATGAMMSAVRAAVRRSGGVEGSAGRGDLALILEEEERLIGAYGDAMRSARDHPEIRDLLAGQLNVIEDHVAALRGR